MKIYNTLTGEKEEFVPVQQGKVGIYVCGVTVYAPLHLGHIRSYVAYDVMVEYLRKFKNLDVMYIRNITDVGSVVGDADEGEDKIELKAFEQKMHPMELVDRNIFGMWQGLDAVRCARPNISPRASGHIVEIIEAVKKMIDNGFAYELDGNIYCNVSKIKDYGILSGNTTEKLSAGARIKSDERKHTPYDFAVWKKAQKNSVLKWNSPWGMGYPGWHIECSAMSKKFLGESIDIHAGGADLTFPHHENELAQSECANGCKFVNFWLHNGFVTINKEKMSKSLNNFLTIDDLLKKYDSNAIRFFILTNHYRMPVEFNDEALNSAATGAKRLIGAACGYSKTDNTDLQSIDAFKDAMNDDLNTSKALAVLFSLADKIKKAQNEQEAKLYASTLITLGEVLGFDFSLAKKEVGEDELREIILPLYKTFEINETVAPKDAIEKIISIRKTARDNKDWAKSDLIRDEFDKCGILLKDSKEGTTWQVK